MTRRTATGPIACLLALLVTACSPGAPTSSPSSPGAAPPSTPASRQMTAGLFSSPAGMHQELTNPQGSSGSTPGLAELFQLLDPDLSYYDASFALQPWLATDVPSVDNGLWQVAPDGSMQTTWHLRPGISWQDGTPLTSDDLLFTISVYRDKDLGLWPVRGLPLVDDVAAPDAQTIVLHWSQPFISADAFFSAGVTGLSSNMWLLPRHILEQPLQQDPGNFLGLSYWRGDFVGVGPFKMQSWVEGNYVTLVANDSYVMGRPKLDQITIRFFSDRNALTAALLSGDILLPIGRGLFAEDVLQIQQSSPDIKVQLSGPLGLLIPVYPQSINPDPPIIANVQFRRALLMAIDRQEMTESLNYGLGPVADSWVPPDRREGQAVDGQIVRYQHDTTMATQMIEDLGYTKDASGAFKDSAGNPLTVQIATHTQNTVHGPATLAVARAWKDLGIDAEPDVRSAESAFDLQWRATYPGFFLVSRGMDIAQSDGYFTQQAIPSAANSYHGANVARYGSDALDARFHQYVTTVPFDARMAILGQIVHEQTDQVQLLPLFFQGSAYVLGNVRLQNVLANQVWNANQWDLS